MQDLAPELRCALDPVKMYAYEKYIRENVRGKVVADFGTGPGILTWLCLKHGAKKVYAIDIREESLNFQRDITSKLGHVEYVHANLNTYEVPDDVELIIHEILGHLVFDELITGMWINLEQQNKLHLHMDMRFEFFEWNCNWRALNQTFDRTLFSDDIQLYFNEVDKKVPGLIEMTAKSLESLHASNYNETKPFFTFDINKQPIQEHFSSDVLDRFLFRRNVGWRCYIGDYSFDNTPRPFNNWYTLTTIERPNLYTRIPNFNKLFRTMCDVNPFKEDTCPFFK